MGVVELLRAAGRRWYVVVAGLLLTAGLAAAVFRFVPVVYEAKASLLLLPPAKTVTQTTGNPFLSLGGLDVVSGVLSLSLTDTETVRSIVPPRSKTTYTVVQDAAVSGSVLDVQATALTPKQALSTLSSVEKLAGSRLQALQDQVAAPADTQAHIMTITDNSEATANPGSLIRALLAVGAVGIVISFLAAIAVDAAVRRHRQRKASRPERPTVKRTRYARRQGSATPPDDPADTPTTESDADATQTVKVADAPLDDDASDVRLASPKATAGTERDPGDERVDADELTSSGH
ncbi:hypothetical protein [Leifsonia sp. 2MCAF36]|uniref:hypothetical protein n=1 Tax=Leifsonia sp. 2MCAF36 TaxID=3232988 RepID=UPI003F9CBD5A